MNAHDNKKMTERSEPQFHRASMFSSTRLLDVLQLSSTLAAGTTGNPAIAAAQNGPSSSLTKLALPPPPVSINFASFPLPPQVSCSQTSSVPETKINATSVQYYCHPHFPIAVTSSKLAHLPFMLQKDVAELSVEELAKEAMRIAKESIREQEEQQKAATATAVAATACTEEKTFTNNPVSRASECSPSYTVEASNVLPIANHVIPVVPSSPTNTTPNFRLNKFVRRLHDMLQSENDKGVVEWRRGLLVLHSTATFAKHILPRFFNTRNFKTFRRQLNYYGFVHVRSFSNTAAATTTALWVHQDLAASLHGMTKQEETASSGGAAATTTNPHQDPDDLGHILKLRRVEPNEDHKTAEGRRQRKEMALYTVEEDLQVSTKSLQRQQIQSLLTMSSNWSASVSNNGLQQGKVDESSLASLILEHGNPSASEVRSEPPPSLLNKDGVPSMIAVPLSPSASQESKKRSISNRDERSLPFKKKKARLAAAAAAMTSCAAASQQQQQLPSAVAHQPPPPTQPCVKSYRNVSISSSSSSLSSSAIIVSTLDDENTTSVPVSGPAASIKTESSAANLLLLLSRSVQQAA